MRVIAGSARSIHLDVANKSAARPFLEKARGALFNALGGKIQGAKILDIYAGSGALGIEALSRGAESVVFVEMDRRSATVIHENLARCNLEEQADIRLGRAEQVVPSLSETFQLIFIDPPFVRADHWMEHTEGLSVSKACASLLPPEGRLIFRFEPKKEALPDWPGLDLVWERRYGRSVVGMYACAPNESDTI